MIWYNKCFCRYHIIHPLYSEESESRIRIVTYIRTSHLFRWSNQEMGFINDEGWTGGVGRVMGDAEGGQDARMMVNRALCSTTNWHTHTQTNLSRDDRCDWCPKRPRVLRLSYKWEMTGAWVGCGAVIQQMIWPLIRFSEEPRRVMVNVGMRGGGG